MLSTIKLVKEEKVTALLPLLEEELNSLERQSLQMKRDQFVCIDSDDPLLFLLSGTLVPGSCLHIDFEPLKTMALIGLALDGKHRILWVKDSGGNLHGKALLSLLIDQDGNPVLFLQRGYYTDPACKDYLLNGALRRAKNLGIPLLACEMGEGSPYNKTIHSIGGRGLYEYNDILNGLIDSSPYTIPNAQLLFDPNVNDDSKRISEEDTKKS